MKNLAVIIPTYNEGEIIEKVITEWVETLNELNIDYNIIAYDGASKDNTLEVLKNFSEKNKNLIVKKWEKIGHGPTIIKAYRECAEQYEWIFQIDSDNEISPKEFPKFWELKNDYELVIGIRQNRTQDLPRKIMTKTSKILLKLLYGKTPTDTNCPYRLMKASTFKKLYNIIPDDIVAPNVIISAYTGKQKFNFLELPVDYKFRETGVVSIQKLTLLKIAIKSFIQTISLYSKLK